MATTLGGGMGKITFGPIKPPHTDDAIQRFLEH